MINVLQRLAELDGQNPNVAQAKPTVAPDAAVRAVQQSLSEELSVDSLRYLSGVKNTIAECGMVPPMGTSGTPASFSINATAATGDEVANMLNNIMTLAGVKEVTPHDMPVDKPTTGITMAPPMSGADQMKKMMDTMNEPAPDGMANDADGQPEDEGLMGGALGAAGGGMLGGPLGAMAGYAAGSAAGDDVDAALETDSEPDAGEVDISGVGGALAGAAIHGDAEGAAKGMSDGEDEAMTGSGEDMRKLIDAVSGPAVDNAPADPTEVPEFDGDKMAYDPNDGDHRERQAGLPRANPMEDVTAQLFADYSKFVTEGETTMSRAAKGHEKYGKQGMQALAKAGKEGKDLDPIRKKYDKYDEGAKPDFLDMDKDGNKKEPMKKAVADKNKNPFGNKKVAEKFDPLKHVKNPTQGEKAAAKDVKRGSYADRAAMLKSAEADGRLKK